jgi:hypothetical protein
LNGGGVQPIPEGISALTARTADGDTARKPARTEGALTADPQSDMGARFLPSFVFDTPLPRYRRPRLSSPDLRRAEPDQDRDAEITSLTAPRVTAWPAIKAYRGPDAVFTSFAHAVR